ncbi:extracellular solute-binding protein [uncultured Litoreibacter sp.]|uniref:extracellular solute-binding protein n=1 Tax=uncultured Litoreibacter sp. TaxID=1392394 RepID=UPI0026090E35|nr:extracellular solute-binding protein [uncultured Litoreibacter sp.]
MTLKGMTWDHPRGYDPVLAASERFTLQTGVRIEWDKRSLQAFADAPIAQLAEAYDLIVLDHPHVGQIAESGALLPLEPPDDPAASLGGSAESYIWNGQCWAYALDAACQMAAYRPDLAPPLPKRWEDFFSEEAAQYRPLTPLLPVDAFDMFMTLVAGRGEAQMPFDADRFVSDDNGEYALQVLRALHRLGPGDQIKMNPIAVLDTLCETDEFSCAPCLFGYVNYARPGFRKNRVAYFDMPLCAGQSLPRAILGGAGIGVSARTTHPDTATRFARWITSREVQSGVYLSNNGQPANRHTWLEHQNDPDAAGFFKGGLRTIDAAWTRPRAPWFLGFVDAACEIMPGFFTTGVASETFLATINTLYRHHAGRH